MSEKQPLLNNENCKIDVYNYDSIPYSVVSSVSDVSDVNVINSDEIEDGCTPFQASFNTINLLAGIGVMTIPYCFKIGGVIPSIFFLIVMGVLSKYTASLIGKCIKKDNSLNSYSIMGLKLFGTAGCSAISIFFIFELFCSMMANLILVRDTISLLYPQIPQYVCLLIAFGCSVSLTYIKKLVTLSWVSLIGLLATFSLFIVLIVNGLSNPMGPGSLFDIQQISLWPKDFLGLFTVLGIFEMGFSGHSVFPSIYLSLTKKKKYDSVLSFSYTWITILYLLFGLTGALMYGENTLPQIMQNLHSTLNSKTEFIGNLVSWIIIIVPITKFALLMDPVAFSVTQFIDSKCPKINCKSDSFFVSLRTIIASFVLLGAVLIPKFHTILGVMGSALCTVTALIFPILCYLRMNKEANKPLHYLLLIFCLCISVFGTLGAINSLHE
jgi:vesicular inhibitory amino acid transporter